MCNIIIWELTPYTEETLVLWKNNLLALVLLVFWNLISSLLVHAGNCISTLMKSITAYRKISMPASTYNRWSWLLSCKSCMWEWIWTHHVRLYLALPLWPLQTLDSYIDQLPPIGWTRQGSTLVEMWYGFEVWELYEVKHSCRSKFWYDVEYPSVVPGAFCTTITNASNWRAKPGPNPSIQFLHSRPCLLSGAEKISFRSDIL